MTMNPDARGIDHSILPIWIGGDGIDHAPDNARFHPVMQTLEYRVSNQGGRSRQGLPVRLVHSTASTNSPPSHSGPAGSVAFPRQAGLHFGALRIDQTETVHGKLFRGACITPAGSWKSPNSQQALLPYLTPASHEAQPSKRRP